MLFELLSGKRAFPGESVTDTLAMVLKVDPDWEVLPARAPAQARRLLACCLKKERSERLQAIGDARLLLAVDTGRAYAEKSDSVGLGCGGDCTCNCCSVGMAAPASASRGGAEFHFKHSANEGNGPAINRQPDWSAADLTRWLVCVGG